LTDLFKENPDMESFEKSVIKLQGNFSFDKNEMYSLGMAYFQRYPDRKEDRNPEEIRIGYRVARICITETLVKGFSNKEKNSLRRGFNNLDALAETAKVIKGNRNQKEILEFINLLNARLESIDNTIMTLPKGMVRERFTGALSTSSNTLYLFSLVLDKNKTDI